MITKTRMEREIRLHTSLFPCLAISRLFLKRWLGLRPYVVLNKNILNENKVFKVSKTQQVFTEVISCKLFDQIYAVTLKLILKCVFFRTKLKNTDSFKKIENIRHHQCSLNVCVRERERELSE